MSAIPDDVREIGPYSKGYTCRGCPVLKSKRWEEFPVGERDSGTYNTCGAMGGRLIDGVYGHSFPTTPDWCPATRPSEADAEAMAEALRPFAEFARHGVDEHGWTDGAWQERISTWFGPSDFRRARTAYEARQSGRGR